jgi:hypothetical protein
MNEFRLCPIPVFVDDGWPFGQCLREQGHSGLCDVYDGRDDSKLGCAVPSVAGPGLATPGLAALCVPQRGEQLSSRAQPREANQCAPSKTVGIYAEDPRPWLHELGLWCGTRTYDDRTKEWLAKSGHYLDAPPPGALMCVSLESLTRGLFGPVPSGELFGLALLGRPIARNLPQDGTMAELTRFVLVKGLAEQTASRVLRVAAELWSGRPLSQAIISYHDRSRHSGCIYKKAGFRKNGVTRAGTRRGSWSSRPGREQGASSEEPSKRRWRLDCADVRAGVALRTLVLGADPWTHQPPT